MTDPTPTINRICEEDTRYAPEGYMMILEASDEFLPRGLPTKHLTAQEFMDELVGYLSQQYGLLIDVVLGRMNIQTEGHIGDMVYNLIDKELLSKTDDDKRSDFVDDIDLVKAVRKRTLRDLTLQEAEKPRIYHYR